MTTSVKIFLFGCAWAAFLGWASAQAQTAPADPSMAVQVANAGKRPIVAVYTSASGRNDWSDDMLGKATLKPGQAKTLKLKAKPGECQVDFSALTDSGDTVTKPKVDMCAASPAVGF